MSASVVSDTTVDPIKEEASGEIVVPAVNPSSEETLSGSTGYETAPDVLGSVDYSPSSEEITSELSTTSQPPPELLELLAQDPEGYDIPEKIRKNLPSAGNIPPNTLALSSNYKAEIPSDVSGEVTDESGQVIFQKMVAATEESPGSPNLTRVSCIRRIWLQKDPWMSYHRKHQFFFSVSHFLLILGLTLLCCRFSIDLPLFHKMLFTVFSGILLFVRCLFMHLLIPGGPPVKATKYGVRLRNPRPK